MFSQVEQGEQGEQKNVTYIVAHVGPILSFFQAGASYFGRNHSRL
jgi:hypothetical protein